MITQYDYREHEQFQSEEDFFNAIVAGFTSICEENRVSNYGFGPRNFAAECAAYFIEIDRDEYQSFYDIEQYNRFINYVIDGCSQEGHVIRDL